MEGFYRPEGREKVISKSKEEICSGLVTFSWEKREGLIMPSPHHLSGQMERPHVALSCLGYRPKKLLTPFLGEAEAIIGLGLRPQFGDLA